MLERINTKIDAKSIFDITKQLPPGKNVLNKPTGDFFYDEWTIKPEYKNSPWKELLDTLPFPKGEARIIQLKPGTCYTSHSDIDDRWHLALQKGESYLVDLDKKDMHQTLPGIWYIMDAGRLHSAVNFGDASRYQLVVRKLLNKNTLTAPVGVNLSINNPPENYRYVVDQFISPKLNYWNKNNKLSNFKQNNDKSISFMLEKDSISELEKAVDKLNLDTRVIYDSI